MFLSCLHRRRTQVADIERLEICFSESKEQQRDIISNIVTSRVSLKDANILLKKALKDFDHLIDGKNMETPDLADDESAIEE